MGSLPETPEPIPPSGRWLSLPFFPNDEDRTRIAYRLYAICWACIILSLVYVVIWLFLQPERASRAILIVPILLLYGLVLALIKVNRVTLAVRLFLCGIFVLTTVITATAGGTQAPFFGFYALVVLSAVYFAGWPTAAFVAVLALIAGVVMSYLGNSGTMAEPFATPTSALLTQATLIILIVVAAYIVFRDNQKDMARRQKTETALSESEARFRLISSVTSDYTFSSRLNAQGELEHTLLTGAFEAITGYSPAEYRAMGGWRAALHPDDRTQDDRDLAALRRNERVVSEVRFFKKGGEVRWGRVYAHPVWDLEQNRLVGIEGAVQDITERKRLEMEVQRHTTELESLVEQRTTELRRAKEQLELILNNTSDALAFADPKGNLLVTNPAFLGSFSTQEMRAIENILASLTDEDQIASVSDALVEAMYGGQDQRVDVQIAADGGQKSKDLDLTLIPVSTPENDLRNGVLLSGRDITHLKEIERFKARFVADALHDLATPISGLSTRVHMLQRNPEQWAVHAHALENQVQHLINLLDDLRTLSQIDRGQIALSMATSNVNELVKRVFDTYEPVALDKQQTLTLHADPTMPDLRMDPRQIERVLVNLVSNAVLYTPENKTIAIATAVEDKCVLITVTDQGFGIPAEDLPHIFDRFFRTTQARQTESRGTGLGLAIAREIVEQHGGTITVTSQPDLGSTFTIRLPATG